jgi:6-phosphogluconolactonase
VYLLNEFDATLNVLPYDAKSGTLKPPAQTVSTMPPGSQAKSWAADLHLTPDGKYLYASERTTSTLAAFRIDPKTGKLARLKQYGMGKSPNWVEIVRLS